MTELFTTTSLTHQKRAILALMWVYVCALLNKKARKDVLYFYTHTQTNTQVIIFH